MSTFWFLLSISAMGLAECFVPSPVFLSGDVGPLQKLSRCVSVNLSLRKAGPNVFRILDGIRRSRTSARAIGRGHISATVSAAINKWDVLEKFQQTAEMDDFVVSL
jgi:hypothetical protein